MNLTSSTITKIAKLMLTQRGVACEVKAIGDKLSEDQKAFLRKIKDANGIALVAFEGRRGNVEMVDFDQYMASKI